MYEIENTSPPEFPEENRDNRLSNYLSLGFTFGKLVLNHITYYQPNLERFNDFRLNTETSINLQIYRQLSFTNSFTLIYDARPPATVRKTRYALSSGIRVNF